MELIAPTTIIINITITNINITNALTVTITTTADIIDNTVWFAQSKFQRVNILFSEKKLAGMRNAHFVKSETS